MRYCPKCGNAVGESSRFCGSCGYVLPANPPQEQPVVASPAYYREKEKTGGNRGLIIAICAAALVLVIGVLAVLGGQLGWFSRTQKQEDTPIASDGADNGQQDPSASVTYYVTGVEGTLKVREGEDGSSAVLTKLENGDSLTVLTSGTGQYWQVTADGVTGYVDHNFITDEAGAVTEPTTYYVDDTARLSLLDIPSASGSSEVSRVFEDDAVTVIARPDGKYWYVCANNIFGYAEKEYLTKEPPDDEDRTDSLYIGAGTPPTDYVDVAWVNVQKNYLALRSEQSSNASNIIGKMYNGSYVCVIRTEGTYWYVYAPSLGQYGYTDSNYLSWSNPQNTQTAVYKTVRVQKGYLALRTAKAYDSANEIGKLYTGDVVEVLDTSDDNYWYVYAPSLDMHGYVNASYLY